MTLFESCERRIDMVNKVLNSCGIPSIEGVKKLCDGLGVDVYNIVKGIQPIYFENVYRTYIAGTAVATKKSDKNAYEIAKLLDEDLQSFCIPGSVTDDCRVGIGRGNLVAMLLNDETKCFAFLVGHESLATAGGTIGIVRNADKVREKPLRVILNGLGKDIAKITSRINGFTYVEVQFNYFTGELKELSRATYSQGERAAVNCYDVDDVREGVAVIHHEGVDVSITSNSTNPMRFQHPVAGTYRKECVGQGKKYFSVASGGGTGRTLHPSNIAVGSAFYGMTDTMGRMHFDTQSVGSSSVPTHVEMMGLIGIDSNPMVGAGVAVAVAISEAMNK